MKSRLIHLVTTIGTVIGATSVVITALFWVFGVSSNAASAYDLSTKNASAITAEVTTRQAVDTEIRERIATNQQQIIDRLSRLEGKIDEQRRHNK